ncbi:IS4 family transposase [Virgisporangium aurantiacum]|uniref:Transposase n=1 Tax=Virgisporangium aurantiacum TaxID=175570 RepID=A0A8J4E3H3_9ACTN|nr:IS4 family transposase [Virgisporangium aurantiacum]GIJ60054.1 transposase [Virgisporangium aurantiacum]
MWQRLGLGVLAEYVPALLIDEVLVATGRMQQRIRRLPARVTVLFVLALTLFADLGYRSVWRELAHSGDIDGGGDGGVAADPPSSSGLAQARRRVGLAPLAALFARVRGTHATVDTPGAFRFGLRLVAWDATMLDVPDSDDNAAAFIRSGNRRGGGAFPKVRLMTLIEVGTHAVIDATFGPDSEQVQARALLNALRPGMLLLADRNFPSWRLWNEAAMTGAHLLWRAKTSLHLPRVATFTDGSWLAVLPKPRTGRRVGTWVRVIEYTVTVTCPTGGAATTRTELFRLITTITDPTVASAAELAGCYRERWESETCYKSIKTHQRGPRAVLRSTDPDGIRQEIYAYLITYQAVRHLIAEAATNTGVDPDRLSFTTALRTVRRWITTAATATTAALATARTAALAEISRDTQHRRDRNSPRAVKRSQAPYPAKRHASQQTSTHVDYHIDVIPDPHA